MPKAPSTKDALLFKVLRTSVERHAQRVQRGDESNPVSRHDCAAHAARPAETVQSFSKLQREGLTGPYIFSDMTKRWLKLRTAGRSQTFEVLHAIHTVLNEQDASQAVIEGVLSNTLHIGRLFGHLKTSAEKSQAGDRLAIESFNDQPSRYFVFDSEQLRVDYTQAAKELMAPWMGRGIGCVALGETVDHRLLGRMTIFDLYWQYFTGEYIQQHVLADEPYQTPSIADPEY